KNISGSITIGLYKTLLHLTTPSGQIYFSYSSQVWLWERGSKIQLFNQNFPTFQLSNKTKNRLILSVDTTPPFKKLRKIFKLGCKGLMLVAFLFVADAARAQREMVMSDE